MIYYKKNINIEIIKNRNPIFNNLYIHSKIFILLKLIPR